MRKPYNRAKCIIGLFLFELIVVVQDKLRLVVKPQHSALSIFSHLLRVFHLPRRYIAEFGSVDFRSQIDVLVELDFGGDFCLVLEAWAQLEKTLLLAQLQTVGGVVLLLFELV
jgi:hypothetical protein